MNEQDLIYNDYIIIKNMMSKINVKSRCLSNILSQWKQHWRVIGITLNALNLLSENEFKYKTRIGINRAHISQDRIDTNTYLLNNDLSFDDFWSYIICNDATVLATSSENKKNEFSKILPIDESLNLFTPSGFKWKHNKSEIDFLKDLYNKHLID